MFVNELKINWAILCMWSSIANEDFLIRKNSKHFLLMCFCQKHKKHNVFKWDEKKSWRHLKKIHLSSLWLEKSMCEEILNVIYFTTHCSASIKYEKRRKKSFVNLIMMVNAININKSQHQTCWAMSRAEKL